MKILILVGCILLGISCSQPKKCHHRSFFKSITDSALYDKIKYADAMGIAFCGELIGSLYYYKFVPSLEIFWDTSLYIRKQGKQYFLLSKDEYLRTHLIKEHCFLDFSKKNGDYWLIPEFSGKKCANLTIVFDSVWHNPDFTKIKMNIDSLSLSDKKDWQYDGDLYCFSLYPHGFTCGHIYATEEDIEYMRLVTHGTYNSFSKFRPKFKYWFTKGKIFY